MSHGKTICSCGVVISQCRCFNHGNQVTRLAGPCPGHDLPIHHKPKAAMDEQNPKEHILQFFAYAQLKSPELQAVSKPFCDLAIEHVMTLRASPERTECLRKLLEAKDCAVRAALEKP